MSFRARVGDPRSLKYPGVCAWEQSRWSGVKEIAVRLTLAQTGTRVRGEHWPMIRSEVP